MKNIYYLVLAFFVFAIGFSQTTIVTIDRANVIGPTDSGNDPSITSVGITRGAGVNQRAGTDFSSNNWTGASQVEAVTNNDYMQWSTSSSASNSIEIERIDIRLRRNPNGPTNWQLYYSLDNFATAGIAVNTAQSIPGNTNVITNITPLSILSGASSTITFRLYAWGAATNGGWLRVRRQASWTDFGIALPGLRLRGTITPTTSNSIESNIVTTAFDPTDNINYTLYSATSGLTTGNAIKIGEFSIQDGGDDLTDADNLPTVLTDVTFDVANSSNIAALAIFDGATNISEVSTVSDITSFNGITGLSALDNSAKTFDIYATFNSTVTDNEQIQLSITSATADISAGSAFAAFDAGGAQTPIVGDDNRIEVTASSVVFDQQPTDSFQFEIMTPFPTIIAVDGNGNQDIDYSDSFNVISSGSLDPSPITYPMTNGLATFNTIVFTDKETVTTLLAFGSSFFAPSASFNIFGPLITIAIQDFDSSTPEWPYTTDVPTFDNGWGLDGYYGVIDIAIASPLNNPSFSNNIFGENDLNDEGDNGTNGFATLSLDPIDISNFENVTLSFDWDVQGYANNNDDAQYRLIYDGVPGALVFLLNGNGAIESDQGTVSIAIPNTVSTVALEVRVRNNGINGYSGFDNFKLVSVFDGLLYTNNGWLPAVPDDTTGAENAYVLDGTYTVGSNIELKNLFINDLAITSVAAGQSITSNSGLVNRGTLELNSVSTSYSSLIVTNDVTGDIVYKRHVNMTAAPGDGDQNDLIAPPVFGQTFGDFALANPNIVENPANISQKLFGPFDKSTGSYLFYDTDTPADANAILNAGTGYRAASSDTSTLTFQGQVTTGTESIPIFVSGPSFQEWNLIGNPYPSYVKLSDFLAANNSEFSPISSGIYGYDGDASDGYTIWNQAYSDSHLDAVMTPGQGFLIASKAGGGTITFTPLMRSKGTTDDFIIGRMSNPNVAHLKLQMSSANKAYKTDLYFNDNASLSMDPGYDAAMFGGNTPEFSIYSHLVDNNQGTNLAVQAVNYGALNNVTIPLGVKAAQGQQITIGIEETTLPDNVQVYLEDNLTNTFTLLNAGDYTFTTNSNIDGTGRFFLRYSEDTLSLGEQDLNTLQIYTTKTPSELVINGQLSGKTALTLYDIQGRLVLTASLDHRLTSQQINISHLSAGVYVAKLSNTAQQKSQKVIIR